MTLNYQNQNATQNAVNLIAALPSSSITVGGMPLSALVLGVTQPVVIVSITSPSAPPPSPPPSPPPPSPPPPSPPPSLPPASPPPPVVAADFFQVVTIIIIAVVGVCSACSCARIHLLRRRRQQADAESQASELKVAPHESKPMPDSAAETRKGAHAALVSKLVVEWSDLKLGNPVAKGGSGGDGGIGALWEAFVDDTAPVSEAADGPSTSSALAQAVSARAPSFSPRSRAVILPRQGQDVLRVPLPAPLDLPAPPGFPRRLPPIPPAGDRYSRAMGARTDRRLTARILCDEVVSLHSHDALVEMALALVALSPPERGHPHVLPTLGLATNGARKYALLTPHCQISLQGIFQLAEQSLSFRLSLVTESNNLACAIADGLTFLHGQGVAHAALHPGNVLLDEEMRPLLADYGPSMCRLRATHARATASKSAARTPQRRKASATSLTDRSEGITDRTDRTFIITDRSTTAGSSSSFSLSDAGGSEPMLYLSPALLARVGTPQLWSAERALDIESDMWALGCLMARLATLKPLYYKERPAMLAALAHVSADERAAAARACISSGAWRPAAQLEGEAFLPLGLLELVAKCTSLRPTERPSSAQVHLALKRLYQEESEVVGAVEEYDVTVRPFRDAYRAVARIAPAPAPPRELERRRQKEDQMRTQFDLDGDGVITRAEVESVAGKNVSFDIREIRRLLSGSDLNA